MEVCPNCISLCIIGQSKNYTLNIDGRENMKLIYGTAVARKKGRVGKEDKLDNHQKELEEVKNMARQEHVAHLTRKSSGSSMYRGVTRHHQHGRWQARIGRVAGNKDFTITRMMET
ncbi:hypothetical protein DITRI_Ditri05aG0078800 [Diplodiscus trichospermus]